VAASTVANPVLRLTFQAWKGDAPTLVLAPFVRFCPDGTLRGPDNFLVAKCVDGLWHLGGRAHRDLDCEGPVRVRITAREREAPVHHGPFQHVRTVNGVLHGDDASMNVRVPGRIDDGAASCHELAFLSITPVQPS
jgi:hypothetical protein